MRGSRRPLQNSITGNRKQLWPSPEPTGTPSVDFARQIWEKIGRAGASLGTLGVIGKGLSGYSGMTTPDPIVLHKTLQDLRQKKITHLAMEASSIGIEQCRLDGVKISAAGYTNLTHDHLDYHHTMENYKRAKLKLFSVLMEEGGIAVVNADTPEFEDIRKICTSRDITCWGYGEKGDALKLISRTAAPNGQNLSLGILGQRYELFLPLVGVIPTMNALCALGLVLAEDQSAAPKIVKNTRNT